MGNFSVNHYAELARLDRGSYSCRAWRETPIQAFPYSHQAADLVLIPLPRILICGIPLAMGAGTVRLARDWIGWPECSESAGKHGGAHPVEAAKGETPGTLES